MKIDKFYSDLIVWHNTGVWAGPGMTWPQCQCVPVERRRKISPERIVMLVAPCHMSDSVSLHNVCTVHRLELCKISLFYSPETMLLKFLRLLRITCRRKYLETLNEHLTFKDNLSYHFKCGQWIRENGKPILIKGIK